MNSPAFIYSLGLCFAASIANATPLVTDRPDATESSSVVGDGVVQLETGILLLEGGSSNEITNVFGTLVRIGLADDWELRAGWDGYNFADGENGIGDSFVGFKRYLKAENGTSPEMALIVHTTLPVGDKNFSSDAFDPSFLLAFSHSLSESLSLGYNVGASASSFVKTNGDKGTLTSADYSIALGYGIDDRVGAFIEIFGSVGLSSPESPVSFDGGFTYLINDDTQLDLYGGLGLNHYAPDWFVGVRFSRRWG
ncbi:MAG: transporter [Verrucomicrobia bacterium]|nr:transporter [Verrucomicrobiota bacterium]MDA1068512.1 transporter [Verrucomicrobiota bacterium]